MDNFVKEIIHSWATNMHQIQAQTENWLCIKQEYIVLLKFTNSQNRGLVFVCPFCFSSWVVCFFLGFVMYFWRAFHCVPGWMKSKGNLAGNYFSQYCCSVQASSWKFSIGRLWGLSPFSVFLSVIWVRNTAHFLNCQCFCATGMCFSVGNPWERSSILRRMEPTWWFNKIW